MKRNELNTLKNAIGQHVLIEYIQGKKMNKTLRKLREAYFDGIIIDTPTGERPIADNTIKNITIKNLSFLTPREFFFNTKQDRNTTNIHMDMVTTQTIEHMKNLSNYELFIRSAKFIKNGSLEKYKQQRNIFEMEVFNWIKKPQYLVELCPLALLNNQFLLAIYMKRFMVFKQNLSIVFADKSNDIQQIIDFIFTHNDKIIEQRGRSLRSIAEDLL